MNLLRRLTAIVTGAKPVIRGVRSPKAKDAYEMHPLVALCYTTVVRVLVEGEAKGHGNDDWKREPRANHAIKAARHNMTAQGIDTLPNFFPDRESAIQHAEQALVRQAMYLWHLVEESKRG
jgi:hypothetical protein